MRACDEKFFVKINIYHSAERDSSNIQMFLCPIPPYLFGAVSVVGLNPPVPASRPNLSDRSAISPINWK